MTKLPSLEGIQKAENISAEFDDYSRFDLPSAVRQEQTDQFVSGDIYAPSYTYPQLVGLYDDRLSKLQNAGLKQAIQQAETVANDPAASIKKLRRTARTLARRVGRLETSLYDKSEADSDGSPPVSPQDPHAFLDTILTRAEELRRSRGIKQGMVPTRSAAQRAVLYLESAKGQGIVSDAELELYELFYETRLKRMALADAAKRLNAPATSAEDAVNRASFTQLNEALYGEMDVSLARSMLATEAERATALEPKDEVTGRIRSELLALLPSGDEQGAPEPELMSREHMQKLHDYVASRYHDVLAVVPDTDDSVYYDADDCVRLMKAALEANGLAAKGWTARKDENKSIPTTNDENQEVILPTSTRRNASQLRRLIIHELEAHARRSQNGIESGLTPLRKGTAAYADVEEGFGVLLECAAAGNLNNPSFDRARDRYITASLALGADGLPRDAHQTFSVLWRMLALRRAAGSGTLDAKQVESAKREAYTHIENAFRGTPYVMPGIIFRKLKVYYEGLKKNADFFAGRIDGLDAAFEDVVVGKYNHTDPAEAKLINEILAAKNTA